jgi:hypothetical protein
MSVYAGTLSARCSAAKGSLMLQLAVTAQCSDVPDLSHSGTYAQLLTASQHSALHGHTVSAHSAQAAHIRPLSAALLLLLLQLQHSTSDAALKSTIITTATASVDSSRKTCASSVVPRSSKGLPSPHFEEFV